VAMLNDKYIEGPWFDGMKRIMVDQALTLAAQKGNLGTGTLVQKACEILGFREGTEEAKDVQRYFDEEWEVTEEWTMKSVPVAEATTSDQADTVSAPTSQEQ